LIETIKLNEAQKKSRRNRNVALALVLAGFVVLVYFMSLARIGGYWN
jgi:ferric-dicitrate binding protein FerR (iron transport regulator)